ncbi:hypothetical protein [Nonomuraea wenchangensis]|uniref:hypothetical protein n=1 Tax=Nonomuraea wenchangensis TaxID=568860 RepID=UPI003329F7EF
MVERMINGGDGGQHPWLAVERLGQQAVDRGDRLDQVGVRAADRLFHIQNRAIGLEDHAQQLIPAAERALQAVHRALRGRGDQFQGERGQAMLLDQMRLCLNCPVAHRALTVGIRTGGAYRLIQGLARAAQPAQQRAVGNISRALAAASPQCAASVVETSAITTGTPSARRRPA